MGLESNLNSFKVIVSTGTGGVGKTTVSAALGVLLASKGKKVLVLTIDPAKRLAQALGLEGQEGETVQVPLNLKGELHASMIDAKGIFDRFVDRFSPSMQIAQRLKSNRLYRQLVTALTGSQEFTSLERLVQEMESARYDVVILDTPPTQNAIDFFKAPQRIAALFDQTITKWFVKGPSGLNFLTKILSKGTQAALAALERVTGSEFVRELSDFFEQMSYLQEKVSERSLKVKALMEDSKTGFLLVTSGDSEKQKEAMLFIKDLSERKLKIQTVIVNRAYPKWLGKSSMAVQAPPSTELDKFYMDAKEFYLAQEENIKKFKSQLAPVSMCEVPEDFKSLNGLEDIVELSNELEAL